MSSPRCERPWSFLASPLRGSDPRLVAGLLALGLAAMVGHWFYRGGHRGRWIDVDEAPALVAHFQVDVNSARWPELAQLPGIGETLARRIVHWRETEGPFAQDVDLMRVHGVGPKLLERIRPYLRTNELPRANGGRRQTVPENGI